MKRIGSLLLVFFAFSPACLANPAAAYHQAVNLAATGNDRAALASFGVLEKMVPQQSIWQQRISAARKLIHMRANRQTVFPPQSGPNPNLALATAYAAAHPLLQEAQRWPAIALAVIFPGAGHAWQGRWHDAGMAALMVWPMLILTLWAGSRRMGPVTVFFALITVWLWSGTVFSSLSLAERASAETYLAWWQNVWQASGLPGRPW